jgi:hypothetical protein
MKKDFCSQIIIRLMWINSLAVILAFIMALPETIMELELLIHTWDPKNNQNSNGDSYVL